LKSERATKAEIRQLKGHGILGKRAPSCSLLCAEDMIKLLGAFAKDSCVRDLRAALAKDRKNFPEDPDKPKITNLQTKRKALRQRPNTLKPSGCSDGRGISLSKRPKLACSKPNLSPLDLPKHSLISDSNGLDALYSALLAFSNSEVPNSQESESTDSCLSPSSISSPLSTTPSTDSWSFPSPLTPSSPSSPMSDSYPRFRDTFDSSSADEDSKPIPLSALSLGVSFSTPTVLRPRRKKPKPRLLLGNPNSHSLPSESLSNLFVGPRELYSTSLNLVSLPVLPPETLQSLETAAFQISNP